MLASPSVNARERLQDAESNLYNFKHTIGFDGTESTWRSFLIASNGVYTSLKKGSGVSAQSRQWFGNKKRERRNDELLSYMHQARNAAEHDVLPLLKRGLQPRGQEAFKMGFLYDNIETEEGIMGIISTKDCAAKFVMITPPDVHLAPITNDFGETFNPPTMHMGKPLASQSPVITASHLLAYLGQLITEAEALEPR